VPLRVKLFLWLACQRRVWTADRHRRRGFEAHDNCLLCDQPVETVDHLLVTCPVAREVWWLYHPSPMRGGLHNPQTYEMVYITPSPMRGGLHNPPTCDMVYITHKLFKTGQITPKAVLKNHNKSQKNHKMDNSIMLDLE
jgi:hypothetical protein